MLRAGVDVMRLNFSHGTAQDHIDRAAMIREASKKVGKEVAIMADLQGPKIRVGKIEGGKTMLEPGSEARARRGVHRPRARASASASTTRSCRATSGPATRCCSTTACCA